MLLGETALVNGKMPVGNFISTDMSNTPHRARIWAQEKMLILPHL